MRKTTWMRGAAALVLALSGALGAARAQGLAEADARFLQAAAGSGTFEVEAAELAQQRAESSKVKAYAAKVREQHRAMNGDLKALALRKQVTLPDQPGAPDRRTLEELRNRTGADFDLVYVEKAAVDAHVMANRLYETAARQSEDPEVRDFAVRSLPGVAEHLAMGRALQRDAPAPAGADRIQPPVKGEAPAVSPASREAPASIAPAAK
ncbi:DUF4142 domain-containing protein [Achromobacter veterisilvae]|uniref:DUF4142 domain-containing protein n=1 Tax=Achromobacter veterisilvae TaxID=2069367 RepID=A0A446CXP3_9BURK|nr:DUF4142 domain-containing protein [Achromobacter veterisilvae]SSW72622.1 hypothetical protein AVE30378_05240 [Achromobacter veterisilvae]